MIDCGSQIILCDMPIRFDTYKGCTHGCKYCFVQRNADISKVEADDCLTSLRNFINGKRTVSTNFCDWDIPLHWGGMSDPFQPIEKKYGISLNALTIFKETQYPFVVSTKGRLLATPEYLEALDGTNSVVQISMVCSKYDVLEKGAPTYEERLEMCKKISPHTKRLIVRIQPYMPEVFDDVIKNLPRLKEAGVYGITIEGMKFFGKKPGLVKVGGDFCYPIEKLKRDYSIIKKECHNNGLKFFCAENRLRTMGDDMCCCGIEGLEGFRTNKFNVCHLINGEDVKPTERMKQKHTASVFTSTVQTTVGHVFYKDLDFASGMYDYYKNKNSEMRKIFGKER